MAGQRMVGIDRDGIFGDLDDNELNRHAIRRLGLELHADLRFEIRRQGIARHLLHLLRVPLTIGVGGGNRHRLLVAHSHAGDFLFQSRNDLPGAKLEAQRIAAVGTVEFRAVGKRAGIVDLDGIAVLRRGHVGVSFVVWQN